MIEFRPCNSGDRAGLTRLWQMAFGDPESWIDLFFRTAFSPERSRAAVENGQIAAALYWFDCSLLGEPFAYVYAVATDPGYQGRGIASALMEDTHRLLAEEGYRGVILTPGSSSLFRFYEKRGYHTAGYVREETVRAGSAVAVRRIGPEEYAALRRELMPPEGVVQEGESLRYLHGFADLYAGDSFAAAVSRHNGAVVEFLGNPRKIPGLLGALGIPAASVRSPGRSKPLAMVHMLRGTLPCPEFYFGLPFD